MSVSTAASPLQSNADYADYFRRTPTRDGFFGKYGGAFIPPALEGVMHEVRLAYETISRSHEFISELRRIRKHFQGRPTPVYHCLLYTSPSPRDGLLSRMPSSA